MHNIIGFSAYDRHGYESSSPPIRSFNYIKATNSVFEEIHAREKSTPNALTSEKTEWQTDTRILAKFLNNLEAGNVQNEGMEIERFAIKRRRINDLNNITLSYKPFVNDSVIEYTDYTQTNDRFIYSVVPIAENELEGRPNEVEVESDFVGWWIVDKEEQRSLGFDASVDSTGSDITTNITQGRVQIDTMTKYPSIYYTDQEYAQLTLEASFLPYEWERSGHQFENILNQFVRKHKPFIVKGSDGSVYVADIHTPTKTTPRNSYKNYDYVNVSISCIEVQDYKEFIEE